MSKKKKERGARKEGKSFILDMLGQVVRISTKSSTWTAKEAERIYQKPITKHKRKDNIPSPFNHALSKPARNTLLFKNKHQTKEVLL